MTNSETNTPAATVLGTIGTVLWCIQLIPQIIYNWRRKDTTGLPSIMMFLWAASGVPFGIYFVVQDSNIPVQVQPHVFMLFALISFLQTLYYPPQKWPLWKVMVVLVVCVAVFAGIEVGCIIPFERLYDDGVTWPVTLVGVIAAVLLGVGLLPPYFELWKRNGQVVGINFIFLTIDSLGALFSIFSLVAQHGDLDILGCVLYIVVLALELGIFSSHIIWMLRTRKARKALKAQESQTENENDAQDEEKQLGLGTGNELQESNHTTDADNINGDENGDEIIDISGENIPDNDKKDQSPKTDNDTNPPQIEDAKN
uniref:ARAD1C21582p n=1 Tax=Blastobotrys adeninivorans TaxID=409370 RepID=A0A060T6N4_BLAAD